MIAAAQIEMRRQYREWNSKFWEYHTSLSQIVLEDFPNPDDAQTVPTRYQLDALRDLALRQEALVEGYESQ